MESIPDLSVSSKSRKSRKARKKNKTVKSRSMAALESAIMRYKLASADFYDAITELISKQNKPEKVSEESQIVFEPSSPKKSPKIPSVKSATKTIRLKKITGRPSINFAELKSKSKRSIPYHIKAESKEHQSAYHSDKLCGSSFHGLATAVQKLIQENKINAAIRRVTDCYYARQRYNEKIGSTNESHKLSEALIFDLLDQLKDLQRMMESDPDYDYTTVLVRYSESDGFYIK